VETTDLIVGVVSAVALLLLLLTAVCDRAWSGPPTACGRPAGPRRITVSADHSVPSRTSYREERRVWLVRPGREIVDRVPAEVQAEALGILDTLDYLDEWFIEGSHAAKHPPLT
jgi:hypothetical protein